MKIMENKPGNNGRRRTKMISSVSGQKKDEKKYPG